MKKHACILWSVLAMTGCDSTVELGGTTYTKLLGLDHGRAMLMEQTAHVEHASALDLARNQRLVGRHPVHGLLLGPEIDPSTLLAEAAEPRDHMPPVRNFSTAQGIVGADDRDWPWWGPTAGGVPPGSNASIAFDVQLVGQPAAQPVGSDGAPACSGTIVWGRPPFPGGQAMHGTVAVTAGHCLDWWSVGDFRDFRFHRGWTLPHNRTGRYGDGTAFTCLPTEWIPAAYAINHNHDYDIAVLDWRLSGCSSTDMDKRIEAVPFVSAPSMLHVGPIWPQQGPSTWSFEFQNWGAPKTGLGTCGPRGDTRPATETGTSALNYWPTMCGMRTWGQHTQGSIWAEAFQLDAIAGHSGGPWLTNEAWFHNGAGRALVGIFRGEQQCPLTCNNSKIAMVRGSWNNTFFQNAGVQ